MLQGTTLIRFEWTVFASIGVILSACYMLWLYQRVFLGKASDEVTRHIFDIRPREMVAMFPLLVLMVWMGSFTQSFLPSISTSNARILGPIEAVQVRNTTPPRNALLASLKELLHAR